MKVGYTIDLIFSVKEKIVAVVEITHWNIYEIVNLLKIQKRFCPERTHRIEKRRTVQWKEK